MLSGLAAMEASFEQRYGDRIVGTLTMIDRMIVNGYVLGLFPPGAFARFLGYQGVRVEDFSSYVQRASQSVRAPAKEIAEKSGRPLSIIWRTPHKARTRLPSRSRSETGSRRD